MKAQTYLLVIALLGFAVVLLPKPAIGAITPSTYNLLMPDTAVGDCSTDTLTLTNTGGSNEVVQGYSLLWGWEFFLERPPNPTPPVLLLPGESMDLTVDFCPTAESFTDDELTIYTGIGNFTVIVSGFGFPPLQDSDGDGVPDSTDNCLITPNGEDKGTCVEGENIGDACWDDEDCGDGGLCSMSQEDTSPPQGNDIGDACDCEGNFDCDDDCDGTDAFDFKEDFGRSPIGDPCDSSNPCNGDFNCDHDCDGTDAFNFKTDFGRSSFGNPCPVCTVGDWCTYP